MFLKTSWVAVEIRGKVENVVTVIVSLVVFNVVNQFVIVANQFAALPPAALPLHAALLLHAALFRVEV